MSDVTTIDVTLNPDELDLLIEGLGAVADMTTSDQEEEACRTLRSRLYALQPTTRTPLEQVAHAVHTTPDELRTALAAYELILVPAILDPGNTK